MVVVITGKGVGAGELDPHPCSVTATTAIPARAKEASALLLQLRAIQVNTL